MNLIHVTCCIVLIVLTSCGSESETPSSNFAFSNIEINQCQLYVTEYNALDQISTLFSRPDLLEDMNLDKDDLANFINNSSANLPGNNQFECIQILNETEMIFVTLDDNGQRSERLQDYTLTPNGYFVFSTSQSNLLKRENELALHAYFLGIPGPGGAFPIYDIDNTLSLDLDFILESIVSDIPLQPRSNDESVLLCQFNYIYKQK